MISHSRSDRTFAVELPFSGCTEKPPDGVQGLLLPLSARKFNFTDRTYVKVVELLPESVPEIQYSVQ